MVDDSYINWLKLILYYFNSKCRDNNKQIYIFKCKILLSSIKIMNFFRFYLDSVKSKIDSHLFTSSSKSSLVINFGFVESLDVPVGS